MQIARSLRGQRFGDLPPATSFAAAIPEFGIAAVIALVTYLLHRKSRIAAIAIASWGVLDLVTWVLFIAPITGAGFAVMRFFFALMAFHGIRGTFAYHRLKREGHIADKAKLKVFD